MGAHQSVIRSAAHTGVLASRSMSIARAAATATATRAIAHAPRGNCVVRPVSLSKSLGREGCSSRSAFSPSKGLRLCTRASASTTEVSSSEAALQSIEAGLGRPLSSEPQSPPKQPIVIVISGPSGVGKDAVLRELQKQRPELYFVVTATTRGKREGEVHGVDYFFVSRPEWEGLMANGELLEHALVYGEYKGIPKAQVREALARGTDVVLRLDVQGAATVKRLLPNAVFVFLTAESEKALVERLLARKTETPEKLIVRAATAREEADRLSEFDYVVVNAQGQLDHAVRDLGSIIDAEKLRVGRAAPTL